MDTGSRQHPRLESVAPRLEVAVADFVRKQHLAGAAAGLVMGDDLAWSAGWGWADVAAGRPPDASTLFMIGSLTKTFTGTAVMQLRDAGLLDLDDPVSRYVPELQERDVAGGLAAVTLRRLLSHESGLMSEPPGTDWGTGVYGGLEESLARRDEIAVRIGPNRAWKYSNLGYQLLGEVVARVGRRPFPDYLRQHVLDPLGMSASTFSPGGPLAARCATGYRPASFADDFVPAQAPSRGVVAEGGLWSSVEDLSRWISAQFRTGAGGAGGGGILDGSTLCEMHKARYLNDAAWTEAWGISWYSTRRGETIWVGHAGAIDGFTAYAGFLPAEQLGVIALTNGIGEPIELALQLGEIVREAIVNPPPGAARAEVPEPVRELVGLYVLEMFDELVRIEWRAGELCVVNPLVPGPPPTLSPCSEADTFVVDGGRDAGEEAAFLRAGDGRVCGLRLAYATYARLGAAPAGVLGEVTP
jgi:D-alanyl-D-alanine carboxypeptidase